MALTTVPASLSATALTLTTAAQPNITSVGTLTGLTVSGNIAGTLTTAAQTNITSVGTLTALTVSGDAVFTPDNDGVRITGANYATLRLEENDTTNLNTSLFNSSGDFVITTSNDARSSTTDRFRLDHATGNIGFYNSAGNTQDFFWDASTERLGIGTTSPQEILHVYTTANSRVEAESTTGVAAFKATNNSGSYAWYVDNTADKFHLYDFTDSAQRVTIDGSGNVGIGNTAPSAIRLSVATPTANHVGLQVENSNTADSFGMIVKGGNDANDYTADFRKRDNTNIMRIRGDGKVGIGSSSIPSDYKLEVQNNTYSGVLLTNTSTSIADHGTVGFIDFGAGSSKTVVGRLAVVAEGTNENGGELVVETRVAGGSLTEKLRIDGSGRVGIGGTPNANWRNDSTDRILTLGTEAAVHSDAGVTTELWNNAYVNNSDQFLNISTRGASRYMQYSGAHKWFTAASASAGSTINTEINSSPKMVLDVSGNLGIGTTSADRGKLHVNNYINSSSGAFSDPHIALSLSQSPTDNNSFAGISYGTSDSDNYGWTVGAKRTTSGVGDFIFTQHTNSATGSERMRIESGGDVGINGAGNLTGDYGQLTVHGRTTDSIATLNLNGTRTSNSVTNAINFAQGGTVAAEIKTTRQASNNSLAALSFHTSGTERMKIFDGGAITKPTQPAFHARTGSSSTSIPPNNNHDMVNSVEIFDQGGDYNTGTYRFTAPVTGKYQFNAYIRWNGLDRDANYYILYIDTSNRSYYTIVDPDAFDIDPDYYSMSFSVLADMDANDVAYVLLYQAGGAQVTTYDGGGGSNGFTGYLVA